MATPFTRSLPFYLGGFMGPFGTMVIVPMFPELRDAFDTTNEAVSWGFTAYTLPMAAFMLFSGTIGERFGRTRVLRLTFGLYAIASVITAAAPGLTVFLVGRALQGTCNAFFTPLLLAGLTDLTRPENVGRQVGVYSSFQAAGGALAPLAGGIAADLRWQAAFVVTAAISAALVFTIPREAERSSAAATPASLRALIDRRVFLIGLAALFAAAGPYVASVLVGLKARDELGLSATAAGFLLLAGSSAGLVLAPVWGSVIDRVGSRIMAVGVTMATSAAIIVVGLVQGVALLTVAWFVAGGLLVGMVVALQSLAATAVPSNRGGALSATMSFRFLGHALGPLIWVPVFETTVVLAFVGASALGVAAAVTLWIVTGRPTVDQATSSATTV